MAKLIIISRLPGIEENTLSHTLSQKKIWPLLSRETINDALQKCQTTNPELEDQLLFAVCRENLQNKVSIIIDAIFLTDTNRDQLINIGIDTDAKIFYIICTNSDENLWQTTLTKTPVVNAGSPLSWADVVKMRNIYKKWEKPHLEIDIIQPVEENFKKLLSFIGE